MRLVAVIVALLTACSALAGASREFDGSADYMNKAAIVSLTDNVTLGCWVRADNNADGVVIAVTESTNPSHFGVRVQEGATEGVMAYTRYAAGGQQVTDAHSIADDGTWQWLSASWPTTSSTMYTYESATGHIGNTLTLSTAAKTDVYIGANLSASFKFEGALAHCACWDVQLAESDQDMLATGILPLYVQPENVVGYWPIYGETTLSMQEPDLQGEGIILDYTGTTVSEDGPPVWTP